MIFPDNFEEKTGFSQIRNMIAQECLCSLGRKSVEKIKFQTDYKVIKHLLEQTEEFRQILLTENQFPSSNYIDASQTLLKISIEGTWAEASDIYELYQSLETIKAILDFFERKDESGAYPHLCQMASIQAIDGEIFYQIEKTINNQGEIKDTASTELQDIRKEIRQKHNMISRNLNHLLNQAKSQGLIASDAELNFRNGRLVIPVPASNKRKIKGYIHDESATGQTVYIEPEEIFEANNEIRELELAERREIIKILIQLCQVIRPHIQDLDSVFRFLGIIDCIRAKAKVALKMEAFKPILQAKPVFKWIKTRHPLLFLAHKAQNKSVVPLDLELDDNQRILVISGPNAGGKSVCLKTAGLVQYMIQCGLLVPMIEYSEAGVFENIFIDIGDQQSLENDLSTYSSHLLNMNTFLKKANPKTLFLIDEFGAGTEPNLGGAIAEAMLEKLNEKKPFGIITTHYANLKSLAGKHESIINGAMLFDTINIKPLFKLKTGAPGSSFAFEIARNIGLPETLLDRATQIAGIEQVSFDHQLQEVEFRKDRIVEKEAQLRSAEESLAEIIDKYSKLKEQLETQKEQIINQAKKEASIILKDTNQRIENVIRQIRESEAEKERTKILRAELDAMKLEIQPDENIPDPMSKTQLSKKKKKEKIQIEIDTEPAKTGDMVRIKGQESIGEVLEINGKDAIVSFGLMKVRTRLDKLEKLSSRSAASLQKAQQISTKINFDLNEKVTSFNPNLDLRGKRIEEASQLLRVFVDDAILLGIKEVSILHGKGDGILRGFIREYLNSIKEVRQYADEHADRGGAGITNVTFRL